MNVHSLRELLTACPEITVEDIQRLKTYRPKRSRIWIACQAAFLELSMV